MTLLNPNANSDTLSRDASVIELMRPITELISANPGVTEVTMYKPGEFFLSIHGQWELHYLPSMNYKQCLAVAESVGYRSDQVIGSRTPLLSATLPNGERMQIVVPPAVEPGTISFSIRIPSSDIRPLEQYEADGAFERFAWVESQALQNKPEGLDSTDKRLCSLLSARELKEFLIAAVIAKKNIAVVGDTGSGKTTLMKSMCEHIPSTERLITIEDVRELFLPKHDNKVHLIYSKGRQGVANVTPADLIASTMRMKPDRVLLAELRGGEAFDFLKLLTTGHSGSITSYHAESCALSYERYVFMAKEHPDAAIFTDVSLKRLVSLTIDVVIHVTCKKVYDDKGEVKGVERFVTEVDFDPARKLALQVGDGTLHHA